MWSSITASEWRGKVSKSSSCWIGISICWRIAARMRAPFWQASRAQTRSQPHLFDAAGHARKKVLAAVRKLAVNEFAFQHRYALVLHTDEAHPHVHLVVKAESEQGERLNIRKATLRHWRQQFAENLARAGHRSERDRTRGPRERPGRRRKMESTERPSEANRLASCRSCATYAPVRTQPCAASFAERTGSTKLERRS